MSFLKSHLKIVILKSRILGVQNVFFIPFFFHYFKFLLHFPSLFVFFYYYYFFIYFSLRDVRKFFFYVLLLMLVTRLVPIKVRLVAVSDIINYKIKIKPI